MNATTVAVDLGKSVFQLAVADGAWRIVETHRLTRTQFERWFANRQVDLVIMEACGSAHHWARWLEGLGIAVKLLEPTPDAGYTTACASDKPNLSVSLLAFGGSPYTGLAVIFSPCR
jgi:hypothetical protein